ncbi:5,6-dimethylbenzimidazole synthase [Chelativorans intermedius]|uniref:5,6-dimethylbenzimidazole synthase n=1 Tax=Chelativorans intermedius TaxID=515947 RepID=A0ABV6DA36_9HYPH|nr:5,6-dimethylbenzimidazole synthase [Chelativorans intermedius]MCT8999671.1 5,6-dimethylbenzimidazole synthase [Chelativorans intermedius]
MSEAEPSLSVPDPAPRPPVFDAAFRQALEALFVWRRDVRRFCPDPLPPGLLERLLDLACLAPSVGLSQPWRFVVVESPERRAGIRANFERCNAEALAAQPGERAGLYARLKLAGLDEAPSHLAVFADRTSARGHGLGRRTMPETSEYSAVMAIHTLWLLARAHGVGLGWVSILEPQAVKATLDVPPAWTFIGYLCLGYPAAQDSVPALERAGWERRTPAGAFRLLR